MKFCRFQRKRFVVTISCVLLILGLQYYLSGNDVSASECIVPEKIQRNMAGLIEKLQNTLDALHMSYFLCYESLWGALKLKGPLPWHKNVDLCVLNKEVSQIDEVFLVRTFRRNGLDLHYSSANGVYTVSLLDKYLPTSTLYVFDEDSVTHQMRRVGWTNRVLPPNACAILHCFPPDLIIPPLPSAIFLSFKLPVPHEEIEIQKYLFPNSWWKEMKPSGCD